MSITLSPVTLQQTEQLAQLASEIWNEYFLGIISQEQINYMLGRFQSQHAVTEQLQQGYQYFFITADNEHIVGYTAIKNEDTSMFLSKFYLLKDARGKGYGRAAMNQLVGITEPLKLNRIWLTVNRYNKETIGMYKHLGFTIVEEKAADIGGGFVMDDYIMELIPETYESNK